MTFVFLGSSDSGRCEEQVRLVFNNFTNDNCTDDPCTFDNIHQPAVFGEFFVSLYGARRNLYSLKSSIILAGVLGLLVHHVLLEFVTIVSQ